MAHLLQGLKTLRAPSRCRTGVPSAEAGDTMVRGFDQTRETILKQGALIARSSPSERTSREHK